GIRLDGHLHCCRERREHAPEHLRLRESGGATADEDGLERAMERGRGARELAQERVGVRTMLVGAAHDRDEVAVAAAMRAEREMDVQVRNAPHAGLAHRSRSNGADRGSGPLTPYFFLSPSRFNTARNAS